jgi:hypothetical protein
MNSRSKGYALLLVIGVSCLAASAGAFGKPPQDADWDPDKPKDPPDQRMLVTLRQYMDVPDAEWQVLLPHITKVQFLSRELRDLRDVAKTFDPAKPFKMSKEGGSGAVQQPAPPSASSSAIADLGDKAGDLRALVMDKSARTADIRAKLATYRAARSEAARQVGQELADERRKLTELLTVRQEMVCVVSGLIE